ncbi:MAG: OB-fold nucleic acid binding domain-containing protein [Methanobacterium sp. ERen5]|nr:MAG: OB-fold nucleic acid binding domain-containing protein [Methanobacterium sp. ERen5]
MNDETIYKLALTTTIFGIVGIILLSGQLYPQEYHINDINRGMLDKQVSIQGVVEEIKKSKNSDTYFLEIADETGRINVVVFHQTVEDYEKYNLKINELVKRRIRVMGTVTEYNGHLEIILTDSKSVKLIA